MLPFRKILFPVDYSAPCEAIVPYVKDITRHFGAELMLVHAFGPNPAVYNDLIAYDPGWFKEVRGLEERRLPQFAAEHFPGQHADIFVEEGEAGTVIHNMVKHQGADLVMMPTQGYGPWRRFLLGSVTAKVLHDVSAAVWTGVGAAIEGHAPGVPYKSVLAALDESEEAECVLKAAAALAGSYGAHLSLLHAVPTPPMALEIDFKVFRKDLMDAADVKLRKLKSKLGIDAPHTVTDSMLIDAFHDEALKRKTDLIVTGRGQAGGTISRLWSRLYPLIREAPCPVLSI